MKAGEILGVCVVATLLSMLPLGRDLGSSWRGQLSKPESELSAP